ncbi:MAG: hydrogenase maturation protease, partial [Acidimicrobiaceae bacterium]|nr:hydrogenase maturation protease [Acidimicrobiaceae bacterium]
MNGKEPGRVLVAGIGNVFFGDDGFGPAVVGQVRSAGLPESVDVADFGIRGVHLAYELLDARYATVVLVDALPMSEPPGTLAVLHVEHPGQLGGQVDAHSMSPAAVLAALSALGATMP